MVNVLHVTCAYDKHESVSVSVCNTSVCAHLRVLGRCVYVGQMCVYISDRVVIVSCGNVTHCTHCSVS